MNTLNTEANITNTAPLKVAKAVKAVKAPKAPKAAKPAVQKPAGDPVLLMYPRLKAWPKTSGPAPSRDLIAMACGLHSTKKARPSKKLLAMAAYLRPLPDVLTPAYTVNAVTAGLYAVMGGVADDDMRNVVSAMVRREVVTNQPVRVETKTGSQTVYVLKITKKGFTAIDAFYAAVPEFAPKAATVAVQPVNQPDVVSEPVHTETHRQAANEAGAAM